MTVMTPHAQVSTLLADGFTNEQVQNMTATQIQNAYQIILAERQVNENFERFCSVYQESVGWARLESAIFYGE